MKPLALAALLLPSLLLAQTPRSSADPRLASLKEAFVQGSAVPALGPDASAELRAFADALQALQTGGDGSAARRTQVEALQSRFAARFPGDSARPTDAALTKYLGGGAGGGANADQPAAKRQATQRAEKTAQGIADALAPRAQPAGAALEPKRTPPAVPPAARGSAQASAADGPRARGSGSAGVVTRLTSPSQLTVPPPNGPKLIPVLPELRHAKNAQPDSLAYFREQQAEADARYDDLSKKANADCAHLWSLSCARNMGRRLVDSFNSMRYAVVAAISPSNPDANKNVVKFGGNVALQATIAAATAGLGTEAELAAREAAAETSESAALTGTLGPGARAELARKGLKVPEDAMTYAEFKASMQEKLAAEAAGAARGATTQVYRSGFGPLAKPVVSPEELAGLRRARELFGRSQMSNEEELGRLVTDRLSGSDGEVAFTPVRKDVVTGLHPASEIDERSQIRIFSDNVKPETLMEVSKDQDWAYNAIDSFGNTRYLYKAAVPKGAVINRGQSGWEGLIEWQEANLSANAREVGIESVKIGKGPWLKASDPRVAPTVQAQQRFLDLARSAIAKAGPSADKKAVIKALRDAYERSGLSRLAAPR